MNQLNYKHLHYFWVVAKTGSISKAAERLHVTPQTISGQLTLFEERLGVNLFQPVGRNIELTQAGNMALEYAEEIFSLGQSMLHALQQAPDEIPLIFRVGISDSVPKLLAYRLLEPALNQIEYCQLNCREGRLVDLLADLSVQRLDLVISDSPMPKNMSVRAFNHLLGSSKVGFFATPSLMANIKEKFPQSLAGKPFLFPGIEVPLRAHLLDWFNLHDIHPKMVAEFDDGAMIKAFGQAGVGVFCAPVVIADEITKQYGVQLIGAVAEIEEHFYAISLQRQMTHPAVKVIYETAREALFASA